MLACFAASLGAVAAPVAPPRWQAQAATLFTHYNDAVASSGTAMVQDGSGYFWLGTQSGLLRWDGYRFRRFAADARQPGALRDGFIGALHVDGRGRLWVGTGAGGLARFDALRETFVDCPIGPGGTRAASVTAIADDGRGGFWIGSRGGLDHLQGDCAEAQAPGPANPEARAVAGGASAVPGAASSDKAAPALPDASVDALLRDRSGVLWIGTSLGLFRRAGPASGFQEIVLGDVEAARNESSRVTRLFQDSAGRVWVGTRGHGAFVVAAGADTGQAVIEGGGRSPLGSDTVLGITEAATGEVWLGTSGGGIVAVDATGAARRIRHQVGLPTSLADDDITALFRDRSGLVWVASVSALSRHDPQQQAVVALLSDAARREALRSPNVTAALARADGRLWLGVGSDGIDIVDPLRGRVGQLVPDGEHPRAALPKARVVAIVERPQGGVFVGTANGLYLADDEGRDVRRLEIPDRDPTAMVRSLVADGDVLWLGGADGLWAIDTSDPGRLQVRSHRAADAFGGGRLMSLLRGRGDDLWIGTEQGLFRTDIHGARTERFGGPAADPALGPRGMVSSLLSDARGRLWLSAYGDGVWLMLPPAAGGAPAFRRFGLKEGLPDAGVNDLLEDERGRIWASTDDGLAVIDADAGTVRALRRPEGVDILSYWTNAGAKTTAGELVFGGAGGLSIVRPARVTNWNWRAPVVVTEARLDATPLPVGRLDPTLGPVAPLEVPPGARLALEFAALDFSAPEQNRYAYRLRGFDADWIDTDAAHRGVSYTNLPPGDYTLELRGTNRDGSGGESPLALPIRVLPAWFQSVGFRSAVVAAVLLLVAALVQARTALLRRRQRELEALVAQRTASLEQRTEELRESQRLLEEIAYADPLTGLPNRRCFADDLRHQVAQTQRGGPAFALLLIDLDGFKGVNDTHGHDAGDAVLVAAAARLLQAVRAADRVARLGGDEFAVLLTQDPTADDVDAVCRRIVAGQAEPVAFAGVALGVGASVSVACSRRDGGTTENVFKAADMALYAAKRGGRNTWRWHAGGLRPARASARIAELDEAATRESAG